MNLLSVRAVTPEKYALALMDCLFEDEKMANSCFCKSKRSTKDALDKTNISLIVGKS